MNPESKTTKPLTLIAFDFGTKSIGVAVGETLTNTAKPLTAVQASRGVPKWEEIDKLIKEWQPNALIVGIPFNMDGTDQHLTQATRDFANQLKKRYKLNVYQCDERMTTIEARAALYERGGYRALKKDKIDALSAKIILESWLSENFNANSR